MISEFFNLTACFRTNKTVDSSALAADAASPSKARSDSAAPRVQNDQPVKQPPANTGPTPVQTGLLDEHESVGPPPAPPQPLPPEQTIEAAGDGNTALVAVFVVIMVIIVIVGIVWKFELHKKIFRARYESVAG